MGDIANDAGVSRQTLYNVFSSKDDILRAMIRLFTDRALAQIATQIGDARTLSEKLDIVLEQIAVRPFETLGVSPNAEDIVLGMNAASRDEIQESNKRFRKTIEKVLKEHGYSRRADGISAKELADFIHVSASAAKSAATSRKHLDRLLQTLSATVVNSYDTLDV